jgi:hypothetical protein
MKATEQQGTSKKVAPTVQPPAKANGAVASEMDTTVLAGIDAAASLPNIDGKPSVLTELPKGLFVEDRDFAIQEERRSSDEVRFSRPGSQDVVRCHPDPERKRVVRAVKDSRGNRGKLYLVTESMVAVFPRLLTSCKFYQIRQYVTDEGVTGLWPAPLPGPKEAFSDAAHLEAQEVAMDHWVRLEWVNTKGGGRFEYYVMGAEDDFGEPQFPETSFDEILLKGLADYIIASPEHPFCKHLLKGTPASQLKSE